MDYWSTLNFNFMKYLSILFILFSITSSCQKDENVNFDVQNEEEIVNYIKQNNLNALKSITGLYYVITKEGTGAQPNSNSNVVVNYKGYFTNGKVFDQSSESGIAFNLQQVISGWTEGITYFKKGGEGVLLVPSKLGYGQEGNSRIPGGSVLIFDIKLLDVK